MKLVYLYSTIKMMHGPINLRLHVVFCVFGSPSLVFPLKIFTLCFTVSPFMGFFKNVTLMNDKGLLFLMRGGNSQSAMFVIQVL